MGKMILNDGTQVDVPDDATTGAPVTTAAVNPPSTAPAYSATYPAYGYELNKLLTRYGVNSPVAPRQKSGVSDDDYKALLDRYNKTVGSTPMYDVPQGGEGSIYNWLLRNTMYGDPKGYFDTRGITAPEGMYDAATTFGWTPGQIDKSMGYRPGDSQNWINTHPNGRDPVTPAPTPTPIITTPAPSPMPAASNAPPAQTTGISTQAPAAPAAPLSQAQLFNQFTPEEQKYATNYKETFSGPQELQAQQGDDWYNKQSAYTVDLGDDNQQDLEKLIAHYTGDNTGIDAGEAATLFTLANRYNIAPAQVAAMFHDPKITADTVVQRLQQDRPHDSYNYLTANGYKKGGMVKRRNYAEGGLVTDGNKAEWDDPLDAILKRYMTENAPDVSAASKKVHEAAMARKAALEAMSNASAATGPSESEKWLNLAAAFADPGKTGNFMEGVGGAAKVLAGHSKDKRTFDAGEKVRKDKLALEALGIDQEVAASDLGLTEEAQKRYDAQKSELMRRYPAARVNYNEPFLPGGKPNKAYQDYQENIRTADARTRATSGADAITGALDAAGKTDNPQLKELLTNYATGLAGKTQPKMTAEDAAKVAFLQEQYAASMKAAASSDDPAEQNFYKQQAREAKTALSQMLHLSEPTGYDSPDAVRADYKSGKLNKQKATELLQQFDQ